MGSPSDQQKMAPAAATLAEFGLEVDERVMSAHRTPDVVAAFAKGARGDGYAAVICGAGMAAHLAGAVAANTTLPVVGVPLSGSALNGLDALYADIELVGRAISASSEAASLLTGMRTRAQAVADVVATAGRPRTFYEVGVSEGTIYTAGGDSFLASLISIAGGEPITGDPLSTSIQLEALVAADPQLILLGDAAYDPTITPASVASRAGWEGMTAVTDGRVVVVPEDPVITRPGPRIVDGLEALARAIHPDLFD